MNASVLNKEVIINKSAVICIGIVIFIFLTALGAYVYIPLPFTPVPITLQTFFVLLCGAFLGKRMGSLSQALYAMLGTVGIPIFSLSGAGLFKLLGPTGGYIIGFVLCAYVVGRLLSANDNVLKISLIFCLGEIIILGCGALWLWTGLKFPLKSAFYLGVLPFIPGDLIKLIAAVFICKGYLKRARKILFS